MDETDANVKRYKKIELDTEHIQIMFNNGYAPPLIHKGNLGVEHINGIIKEYVI